jgi:LCP family protein required for cell wall assembly
MEKNFGITPDYYMVVNFFGMEDIITAMDGVDVNIESKEISNLNACIDEINAIDSSGKASHIKSSGMQHLNGRQAVAYMRIRKVGLNGLSGDAARVLRQQTVLSALFDKATSMSVSQIPDMITALSQYVRTDIPLTQMVSLGTTLIETKSSGLQKFTYPAKFKIGSYKGMSIVLPSDFDEEIKKLRDFLEN